MKKRLLGAVVLMALAIIFIPALIGSDPIETPEISRMPKAPQGLEFAPELLKQEIVIPPVPEPIATVVKPSVPENTTPTAPAAEPKAPKAKEKPKSPKVPLIRAVPPAWVVQVGSFAQHENAQRLVDKLRKAGFQSPDPKQIEVQGKRVYRVRVGPMLEKAKAESIVAKVNATSGTQGRVVPHP